MSTGIYKIYGRGGKSRGIEPIVAAILLIVVTVVAAIILYAWFSGYITTATATASEVTTLESFQILGVDHELENNKDTLFVYVHNTGDVPITIAGTALVLDSQTAAVICDMPLATGQNPNVAPGQIKELKFQEQNTGDCDNNPGGSTLVPGTYLVRVATDEGTTATGTFTVG